MLAPRGQRRVVASDERCRTIADFLEVDGRRFAVVVVLSDLVDDVGVVLQPCEEAVRVVLLNHLQLLGGAVLQPGNLSWLRIYQALVEL